MTTRERLGSAALAVTLLAVYLATCSATPSVDTSSASLQGWRIATTGSPWLEDVDLDDLPVRYTDPPFWTGENETGHVVVYRSPGVTAVSTLAYLGRSSDPTTFSIRPASLLAAGLAFSLTRPIDPLVIAVLLDENGQVKAVVEDFGNEKATVRMLADFAVPRDKTIQLWTLPSKEVGPVSLGLIEGVRSAKLEGPALPAPRSDQLYEITLEQAGGSPTGRPTGPILAKGFARMPR